MRAIQKLLLGLKMRMSDTASCGGIELIHKSEFLNKTMRKDICRGTYEKDELLALQLHLQPQDKVLELGACVGLISAYASKVCGSENVTAIEANPEILSLIEKNHALNNVSPTVLNGLATSEDSEDMPFFVCDNICSSANFQQGDAREVKVPAININTLQQKLAANFLVIDIEGAENQLIPELDLSTFNKILIEIHPYKTSNEQSTDVIQYILNHGFVIDFSCTGNYTYMFTK